MKKYIVNGKALDNDMMQILAGYMADDIREAVHRDLAPCSPDEFLSEYIKRDSEFEEILYSEFGIEETPGYNLPDLETIKTADDARQAAAIWQAEFNNQIYSWEDLVIIGEFWQGIAEKFNLLDEFYENGLC